MAPHQFKSKGAPTLVHVREAARFDRDGLIPAVVQDMLDGTVLMVAWMNREALERTLETGESWFWSRSRQELWHKGATSGHRQKIKALRYDCDSDVLLLTVEQQGDIACHLGERSCFHRDAAGDYEPPPADTLSQVFRVVEERKAHPNPDSYTSRLLEAGSNQILKKIGEEATEVVMAAKDGERVAEEVADLWYHTLVLLAHADVDILDVYRALQQRRR
ncbi:MAG: bifunctional phosphoribosyl-AMP cyclohydrolase/phosphoribosyl-ATP diphosphatase HisIE [Aphanocapsa lilacina HA4352-LM1]|nr:bifunctional phosphoribosyl-AMP cyclohydrolase/phosphoribosyl-ATP diphosphatase HisIE [Aphanocapsa lilacina HA4352-LM1]